MSSINNIFGLPIYDIPQTTIIDFQGQQIKNVGDPIENTDAANKQTEDNATLLHDEISEIKIPYLYGAAAYLKQDYNAGDSGIISGCVPTVVGNNMLISAGVIKIRTTNSTASDIILVTVPEYLKAKKVYWQ